MRFLLPALAALAACGGPATTAQTPAPEAAAGPAPTLYSYRVVATYPHDNTAFTEGLFFLDGEMYESTGLVGRSTIRRVRIADGRVLQSVSLPSGPFGEGIVNWGSQIISLTWQGGIGYRWDRRTLRRTGEWHYPGEGWALTRNEREIIMSDGTAELRVLDPATLAERRRIAVTARGRPVRNLNELEWVDGKIYANIWMTGLIAIIEPADGRVTGIIDIRPLAAENATEEDAVPNGIAYDARARRLFVTGKNWAHLYEIALAPATAASADAAQ